VVVGAEIARAGGGGRPAAGGRGAGVATVRPIPSLYIRKSTVDEL
jgi:hypothetical protein